MAFFYFIILKFDLRELSTSFQFLSVFTFLSGNRILKKKFNLTFQYFIATVFFVFILQSPKETQNLYFEVSMKGLRFQIYQRSQTYCPLKQISLDQVLRVAVIETILEYLSSKREGVLSICPHKNNLLKKLKV